jgi:putative ABC transport system permease protein
MQQLLVENIKLSLVSIRGQLLRTSLTVLIIAIGIMALVGILTAIDSIKQSINSNFTSMGANTFTVRNKGMNIRVGSDGKKPKLYRKITYEEARRFSEEFKFPATVSVSVLATGGATVKYLGNKSNPNIAIFGGDDGYITTAGYEIEKGRNFTAQEIQYGQHVVLIGHELLKNVFKNVNPIDKTLSVGDSKYKVVGILKEKGTSAGFGGDKACIIPLNNARQYYVKDDKSFVISVLVKEAQLMESAIGEATGLFRIIRKVNIGAEENFEIIKADSLANILIGNIKYVTLAATIIGFITLLGAAIGLMNIMLVSVTERTREIGIRKAIGANQTTIKNQFLIEAIVICQMGGFLGIVLGILIGNLISMLVGGGFIIPWLWIIVGVILCLIVGLVSGIYPAIRASKLDPIEALRAE